MKELWSILFRHPDDKDDKNLDDANQVMTTEYAYYRRKLEEYKTKIIHHRTTNNEQRISAIKDKLLSLTGMTKMVKVLYELPLRFDILEALCKRFIPREYAILVDYNNKMQLQDLSGGTHKEITVSKNIESRGYGMGLAEHNHICKSICGTSNTCQSNRYSTKTIGSIVAGMVGLPSETNVESLAKCSIQFTDD